jgi:tetraacyldisaccharide 4'-kinase
MRQPRFWYAPAGPLALLLQPLGALYAYGTARRLRRSAIHKACVPVICIGNINAGGTGKTPTVIAFAQQLQAMGFSPHIVSRGYGGSLQGPVKVDERVHTAQDVGDEPLLLSAFAPTWVAKERALGVAEAGSAGAHVILMDDGHQNPDIFKDLSVVVVDAKRGFGNGHVIPAGPLREPIEKGLGRADLLLVIGRETERRSFLKTSPLPQKLPLLQGELLPLMTGMPWQGMRVLAFAGIGHPEKFFATLRQMGAELIRGEPLSDHQSLSDGLITRLENEAKLRGAQLVTTEKDAVRLPPQFQQKVLTVPVRLTFADSAPLFEALSVIGLDAPQSH